MREGISLTSRTVVMNVSSSLEHSHIPTLGMQPTSQEAGTNSQCTDVLDSKLSSEPLPTSDHAVVDDVISGFKKSEVSICHFCRSHACTKISYVDLGKNYEVQVSR